VTIANAVHIRGLSARRLANVGLFKTITGFGARLPAMREIRSRAAELEIDRPNADDSKAVSTSPRSPWLLLSFPATCAQFDPSWQKPPESPRTSLAVEFHHHPIAGRRSVCAPSAARQPSCRWLLPPVSPSLRTRSEFPLLVQHIRAEDYMFPVAALPKRFKVEFHPHKVIDTEKTLPQPWNNTGPPHSAKQNSISSSGLNGEGCSVSSCQPGDTPPRELVVVRQGPSVVESKESRG